MIISLLRRLTGVGVLVLCLLSLLCGCSNPPTVYYVSGVRALTGYKWDVHPENVMESNPDSIWTKTFFHVEPGTHNFKITDGLNNWWGKPNGDNMTVTVTDTCDVTIVFDSRTKGIVCKGDFLGSYSMNKETMFVPGTFFPEAWVFDDNSRMTRMSDGLFYIDLVDVEPGPYQFKFATDSNWTDNWGTESVCELNKQSAAIYDGFNIDITILKKTNLRISIDITDFDPETHEGGRFWYTEM